MKLYVNTIGDLSAGIPSTYYVVECPFDESDKDDKEMLDAFRNEITFLYRNYAGDRIRAYYDFEMEE